jgi:flagellar FliL protein
LLARACIENEDNNMSSEAVADGAEVATGGKSGKLKWIIIAVAVLAAGGGTFFFLGKGKSAAEPNKEEAKKPHTAALYYKFEPAFVVNFGGEGNSRYLQVTVEVMSRSAEVVEVVKSNEPAIRNDLVMLFSSQQYDALMSPKGKDTLRQDALESIRKVVAKEGTEPEEVEGVYFTSFVIQ